MHLSPDDRANLTHRGSSQCRTRLSKRPRQRRSPLLAQTDLSQMIGRVLPLASSRLWQLFFPQQPELLEGRRICHRIEDRILAAISLVDIGPLDLAAGECLGAFDDVAQV
jgi:hypothetical protein